MKKTVFLFALSFSLLLNAQDYSGTTENFKIESESFGKDRQIDVFTPFAYSDSQSDSAMVIFVFDGQFDAMFDMVSSTADYLHAIGEFPLFIAVGIHTEHRPREFTPKPNNPQTYEDWGEESDVGNSGLLDVHLTDEVMPFLQNKYRLKPLNFGVGHSLGGTYVTNAIMVNHFFKGVLSISPNTQYDSDHLVSKLDTILREGMAPEAFHYMTAGTTGRMENSFRRASNRLDSVYMAHPSEHLKWHYEVYEGQGHSITPMRSVGEGLAAFGDLFVLNEDVAAKYLEESKDDYLTSIQNHYKTLSDWLGFRFTPNVDEVNNFGYIAMGEKEYQTALEVFEFGMKLYPTDANIIDSSGEALENLGKHQEALGAYQAALVLLESQKESYSKDQYEFYVDIFTENVGRAEGLVKGQ